MARWERTYGRIKSMRVAYRTRLVEYRPSQTPDNDLDKEPWGPLKHSQVERIEQGRHYHVRYSLAATGLSNPEWLVEYAFDGKITQNYMGSTENGMVSLEQLGGSEETMNMPKEFMFLTTHRAPYVLEGEYPDGMPELAYWFELGKLRAKVVVRPILEYVVGEPCHVVEVIDDSDYGGKPREVKKVFWLAHDKGMSVMKYQMLWNGKVGNEIEIERIAKVNLDGVSIWYPKKAYRTTYDDRFGTIKTELTVADFVPNVKIDENTFRLNFIEGTRIWDKNSRKTYKWHEGMKFMADEWSNSIRYVPKDWSIMVVTGKPFPTFEGIEIGRLAERIKDTAILLCFFDMEKRPSRNCVQQLSAKKHELVEKDVVIVAIHASTNNRTKLNEWVKEHNIQMAVGTITSDIEKTKFTWGVRALPWLILT
ncbi:MAG: hypothetical protein JSW59_13055, partial [Phycisphaerales bacterium]